MVDWGFFFSIMSPRRPRPMCYLEFRNITYHFSTLVTISTQETVHEV